jgi:hypothetical protein
VHRVVGRAGRPDPIDEDIVGHGLSGSEGECRQHQAVPGPTEIEKLITVPCLDGS